MEWMREEDEFVEHFGSSTSRRKKRDVAVGVVYVLCVLTVEDSRT